MPLTRTELKNLSALSTRKGRRGQGRFLAEGVRLLEEAIRHDVRPEAVFFAPSSLSDRGSQLVERFRDQKVRCEPMPVRQIGKLADTKSPQGIVGLFTAPATDLQKLYRPDFRSILVCDGVADPGNLGTLLRSALAFDFDLVILTGRSTEPYSPKVVRSSMGAMFGLRIAVAESDAVAALINDSGCTVLAATVGDGGDEWRGRIRSNGRLVLTIGSEAEGLSPEIEALATVRAHIAHSAKVESLNAAVAGSILMKEVYDLTR